MALKSIFASVFSIGIVFTCGITSVSAQTPEAAPATRPISTVTFKNPAVSKQTDRTFELSFTLTNGAQAEPQVKYAIVLVSGEDGVGPLDTHVFDEVVSLSANSSLPKTVTYTPPAPLGGGTHTLWLEARTINGYRLSFSYVGDVTFGRRADANAVIDTERCYLTVGTAPTRYTREQGVDVLPSETLQAHCTVRNVSSKSISLTPIFKTHYRTLFGALVDTNEQTALSLTAGESRQVTFTIPKVAKPQAYDAAFTLTDAAGVVSNTAVFHYVLRGSGATIQQTSLDKSYYTTGEQATLTLYWTGSADSFRGSRLGTSTPLIKPVANIQLRSKGGATCADVQKTPLTSNRMTITIPVTKDCADPEVAIALASMGGAGIEVVHDQQEVALTSPEGTRSSVPWLLAVVILVGMGSGVIGYLIYKRRQEVVPTTLLVFCMVGVLASALFYAPVRQASAFQEWEELKDITSYSVTWTSSWSAAASDASWLGINAFFITSNDTYYVDQPVKFAAVYTSNDMCVNGAATPIIMHVRIISRSGTVLWSAQYPSPGTPIQSAIDYATQNTYIQKLINTQLLLPPGTHNVEARFYEPNGDFVNTPLVPNVGAAPYVLDCNVGVGPLRLLEDLHKCAGKVIIPIQVINRPTPGACGTRSNVYSSDTTAYPPADTSCLNGSPIAPGVPPFPSTPGSSTTWKCSGTYNGAESPTCTTTRAAVTVMPVGECGPAGKVYPADATSYGSDLHCKVGTPIKTNNTNFTGPIPFPSGTSAVQWRCKGVNGGTNSGVCTASLDQAVSCGTARRTYTSTEVDYSGTFCGQGVAYPQGAASPSNPSFPSIGGTTTWECKGSSGVVSPPCTANRTGPDLTAGSISPTTIVRGAQTIYSVPVINQGDGTTLDRTTGVAARVRVLFQRADAYNATTGEASNVWPITTRLTAAPLAASGQESVTVGYVLPDTANFMRACVDKVSAADNIGSINESNENNNCGNWTQITRANDPPIINCSLGAPCESEPGNCSPPNRGVLEGSDCHCSATKPEDPPGGCSVETTKSVKIVATPPRVKACKEPGTGTCGAGSKTTLTWAPSRGLSSCVVTGPSGNVLATSLNTPASSVDVLDITKQTTFTVKCDGGVAAGGAEDTETVDIFPLFQDF